MLPCRRGLCGADERMDRDREDAFGKLRRLFIVQEQNGQVSLDPAFKKNFRLALTGG